MIKDNIVKEIIDNLNDRQREAVLYNDGPSLVIAGAGSGKTKVLTCKVAYLLKLGLAPWNILALTFTNKAAREMKERVAKLVDPRSASRLWMGTFHSLFLRILRTEAAAFGYPSDFSVYDTADTKSLLKTIIKELQLDEKTYKVSTVASRISNAKNALISPEDYFNMPDIQQRDKDSRMPRIAQIYAQYVQRCRTAKAMDFDDILFNTNILFRDFPDILAQWQDRFQYILVDEYQDTNASQYLIVKKLAEKHHRVCVVGDDSQSIYSFRGANIENILKFQSNYPESKLFKLEQNYRSTKNIVNIANSLISNNQNRIKKEVFSQRENGNLIQIMGAMSDVEEAYMIAGKISEMRNRQYEKWADFAVLYRTNAQSRVLEEAMRKRNIPYRVYGGMSFYQHKEIKDILAYLRLMLNPNDDEALKRAIKYPSKGIGDTTMAKIQDAARTHQVSLWEVLSNPIAYALAVNNGTLNKLSAFHQMMDVLQAKVHELSVYDFTQLLLQTSGISQDLLKESGVEGITHRENVQSLLAGMHEFCQTRLEEGIEDTSMAAYLSEVALNTDQDEEDNDDKVFLMTVHASKGLEFNNVFVTGMEENIFPSQRSSESQAELEEERRLLYVAITRAGNRCALSFAKSRFRNGNTEFSRPSRFLRELDPRLIEQGSASISSSYGSSPFGNPFGASSYGNSSRGASYGNSSYGSRSSSSMNLQRKQSYPSRPSASPGRTTSVNPTSNVSSGSAFSAVESPRSWKKLPDSRDNASSYTSAAMADGTKAVQSSKGTFVVGQKVLHERFGEGLIKSIEGQGDNCKIGVEFVHAGFKMLLLKFASMRPIE